MRSVGFGFHARCWRALCAYAGAALLCGCTGLWAPFLGEAPGGADGGPGSGDGGGEDQASRPPDLTDTGPPSDIGCAPSLFVRESLDGRVTAGAVTTEDLYGIWGTDDSHVWAVGAQGVVVRWDGEAWRAETVSSTVARTLTTVWGSSATDLVAAGEGSALLQSIGAGLWSERVPATGGTFREVTGSGAQRKLLVGDRGNVQENTGTVWLTSATFQPGAVANVKGAAYLANTRAALVGGIDGTSQGFVSIYDYKTTAWMLTVTFPGLSSPLLSALIAWGQVWAAGENGLLVQANETGTMLFSMNTTKTLRRLRPASDEAGFWVVGDDGFLSEVRKDLAIKKHSAGTLARLNDAWQSSTGKLWLVGSGGTILRCTP